MGGKIYTFLPTSIYVLRNDIEFEYNGIFSWQPLQEEGRIEGQNYQIKIRDTSKSEETYYYYKSLNQYTLPLTEEDYVYEALMLHYDGIKNTKTGHSSQEATWQDISGNGYDGTIQNGTWAANCLNLPEENGMVDTGLDGKSTFLTTQDFTLSITVEINSLPFTNTTYGDKGVLLGAANYTGYSISWERTPTAVQVYGGIRGAENIRTGLLISNNVYNNRYTLNLVNDSTNGQVLTYMNGQLIKTSNAIAESYNTNEIGNIGINKPQKINGNGNGNYANIKCYNVKLYKKALTQAEVEQNSKTDAERFGG